MPKDDSFEKQLQGLVITCKLINTQRNYIYLYCLNGKYYATLSEPDKLDSSVVKDKYQPVPKCCVDRWFTAALREAHYRLKKDLTKDNPG